MESLKLTNIYFATKCYWGVLIILVIFSQLSENVDFFHFLVC